MFGLYDVRVRQQRAGDLRNLFAHGAAAHHAAGESNLLIGRQAGTRLRMKRKHDEKLARKAAKSAQ